MAANRQIEIIAATLQALEDKADENLKQTLPASASSVDYLHHGVGQPRSRRPSPGSIRQGSSGVSDTSPQSTPQSYPPSAPGSNHPLHLDADHPNPEPWRPSSHYPKKKPLEAGHSATPKRRRGKGDPFIDKFIEEIADLVGQGGTVEDSINLRASRDTASSSMSSMSAVDAVKSTLPSTSMLSGKSSADPEDRKRQVMDQLYTIFSQVSGTGADASPYQPPNPPPPPAASRGTRSNPGSR